MADDVKTGREAGAPPPASEPAPEPEPVEADRTAGTADAKRSEEPERALEQDIEELRAKAAERDEYLALAQRTQADFENYRKRTARDIATGESRGVAKLTTELLRALDNLDVAVDNIRPEDAENDYARSLRLAQMELLSGLEHLGVEHYWPVGEGFDPQRHEAMAKRKVRGVEAGAVADVYQRGYAFNGNVLRPARVVVGE